MKTSINTYSYGDYISEDRLGIKGVIDKTKELGADGIEFVEGGWIRNMDLGWARELRAYAEEKGLDIVAYCVGADLVNGCNGDQKEEIALLCKKVDFAAELGVKNMRHDVSGGVWRKSYDALLPKMANGCREVAKYAEQKGIGTMSENHGYFSQDSLRVEKLITETNHDNFGALVDLGNFMCAGENPNFAVGVMSRYAKHVHAKDFIFKSGMEVNPGEGFFRSRSGDYLRATIIGHGNANIWQSIQILKDSGYDGYVSVEFEGYEDNLMGIEFGLNNLKRFIG